MKNKTIGAIIIGILIGIAIQKRMPLIVFKKTIFLKTDEKLVKSEYSGYSYFGNLVYKFNIPKEYNNLGSRLIQYFFIKDNEMYLLKCPEHQFDYTTMPIRNWYWYDSNKDTYAELFADLNGNKGDSITIAQGMFSYKVIDKFEFKKDTIFHIQYYSHYLEFPNPDEFSGGQKAYFIGKKLGFIGMYNFEKKKKMGKQ